MGKRLYTVPIEDGPCMTALDRRIKALLVQNLPTVGLSYELKPPVLPLSGDASAAWVELHDDIERQLAPECEFVDVKNFASKAAENAARLACVFHVIQHGPTGEIGIDSFRSAAAVVVWHLREARRVITSVSTSQAANDSFHLLSWLKDRDGFVLLKDVSAGLRRFRRDCGRRNAAIAELENANLIRREKREGGTVLVVNPKALEA